MSRKRAAGINGTITNNPLAIGGTSLSSAELASLPEVVSPDIMAIVLDPAGTAGDPEIVHVTAHTSSATTATISRAEEGTTARQHASGVAWLHGPTTHDFGHSKGDDIASTADITLPDTDQDYFDITGTTTIESLSARERGRIVTLKFEGVLQLTHDATSFILAGGASRTVAVDEVARFISEGSGNWRELPMTGSKRASGGGTFLVPTGPAAGSTLTSSASANTYGAWVEMIAAAAADLYILGYILTAFSDPTNMSYVQLDIGIGAGASEVSKGEAYTSGVTDSTHDVAAVQSELPIISVLAGERVAARIADAEAGANTALLTLICINKSDYVNF